MLHRMITQIRLLPYPKFTHFEATENIPELEQAFRDVAQEGMTINAINAGYYNVCMLLCHKCVVLSYGCCAYNKKEGSVHQRDRLFMVISVEDRGTGKWVSAKKIG